MKDIRKSVIAGSWYPGNAKVLRSDIETYFRHVPDLALKRDIIGLVAPHAGYVYSGQVAAYAYKPIRGQTFDAVIVISPSHRQYFQGVSLYNRGGYETPLGIVPVDKARAEKLMEITPLIMDFPAAHLQEHALEIQLPFLQVALGEFDFVPLIMGSQDQQTCEQLAAAIHQSLQGQQVLVVGSSDLSHFHDYDRAVKLDAVILDHLSQMDAQGLLQDLEKGKGEACGGGPAATAMMTAKKFGARHGEVLRYANSGDVSGDKSSVVGYAAAIFYK